jgi:antitoxin (DNA-binding transcriptional repressor) of toxin-antitoxin stability system
MDMIKVNIHEAKTHLSRYLEQVEQGEVVVLCRRNVPVAEIRALPKTSRQPRPIGLHKGQVIVPDSFFDPLPDDILDAFEGKGE